MYRLPSYGKKKCCDSDCNLGYKKEEPCYGNVDVIDEEWSDDDYWWIHACEGHSDTYYGINYKPSPYPEDQNVEPIEDHS